MKAFVFTLDAIFALLIAGSGIAVLFYFVYTSVTPYQIQYASSSAAIAQLASSTTGSLSDVPLSGYMASQHQASGQIWPMRGQNAGNDGGNANGPSALTLEYIVSANAKISPGTIVAGYGNVYFAAINTIYAVNSSSGIVEWTRSSIYNSILSSYPAINATALYGGMLVYADGANVVSLNAYNGNLIWSTSALYPSGHTEPSSQDVPMKIIIYNGKVITGTYDSGTSTGDPLYALYANNGTTAGISSAISSAVGYLGVAGGQIAASSSTSMYLLTEIFNGTYAGGKIWSNSYIPYYPGTPVAYSSSLFYPAEQYEYYTALSGTVTNTILAGIAITGSSEFNSNLAIQSTSSLTYNSLPLGGPSWTYSVPSAYGTAINNATPVISNQNVYSLWSNGYLLEQNLSTGAVVANTLIPYSGQQNPYMALAYGTLFTSKGSDLLAYGACPANSNNTLLYSLASLYVNGDGGCAQVLLSSINSNGNYSFTINNKSIATPAYFGGSSYVSIPAPPQASSPSCNLTITAWSYDTGMPSTAGGVFAFIGTNSIDASYTDTSLTLEARSASTPNTWSVSGNYLGKWVYTAIVLNSGYPTAYINGVNESNGIRDMGCLGISSGDIGLLRSDYFKGYITNVQVYSSALSQEQIVSLYRQGALSQPVYGVNLAEWFPLLGDANSYGTDSYFAGYPYGVTYNAFPAPSQGLLNSYSVSSQSFPVSILNYTTGNYSIYSAGLVSWK